MEPLVWDQQRTWGAQTPPTSQTPFIRTPSPRPPAAGPSMLSPGQGPCLQAETRRRGAPSQGLCPTAPLMRTSRPALSAVKQALSGCAPRPALSCPGPASSRDGARLAGCHEWGTALGGCMEWSLLCPLSREHGARLAPATHQPAGTTWQGEGGRNPASSQPLATEVLPPSPSRVPS